MIEIQQVSKTFTSKQHDVHALHKVNLHIKKGEIFGVIGYSGAGKSTLIRCINLLETPSEGSVSIDGVDITKLSDKDLRNVRKKIGMIFQHFNLMRSRTVAQNIAFPLKGSGLRKEEITRKVEDLLALVELQDKKDAYPSQLSGGQKQRVAIARALANDPKVLLCDEATSALDPQTTRSILRLLKQVNERLGLTIVLITHEMAVIKEICDRVAVMENGEIVEQGDIVSIFTKPKVGVTQSFINTTSSISQIYEMIDANEPITRLDKGQTMVHLKYTANHTKEAMLSYVSREWNLDASIIFGNVEVIHGTPIGDMVIIFDGEAEQMQKAIQYLKSKDIEVEVITTCTNS